MKKMLLYFIDKIKCNIKYFSPIRQENMTLGHFRNDRESTQSYNNSEFSFEGSGSFWKGKNDS